MLLRLFLLFLFCLHAVSVEARCRSVDYRDHLTPAQKQQFEAAVARIPYGEGNHWIAIKGGRTLHIIGTMHSGDRRMSPIVRRLKPIIESADALLLEVSSYKFEQAFEDRQIFRKYMLLPQGQSLRRMMSAATWGELAVKLQVLGMSPAELDRLQPWFASELLDRVSCVSNTPRYRGKGLDDRIETVARRARVPIGSLETVGQSFGALMAMPKRDHVRLIELELERQRTGQITFNKLDDAYFEEAVGQIMVMSRWSLYTDYKASRAELDQLHNSLIGSMLNRRNRNWIPVILRTKGDTLVVAVGAAHLPGREGILNLLRQQGYTLQRAPF